MNLRRVKQKSMFWVGRVWGKALPIVWRVLFLNWYCSFCSHLLLSFNCLLLLFCKICNLFLSFLLSCVCVFKCIVCVFLKYSSIYIINIGGFMNMGHYMLTYPISQLSWMLKFRSRFRLGKGLGSGSALELWTWLAEGAPPKIFV